MIPRTWLFGWALAASFLAAAGIWEAVRCHEPAAPSVVEIPKIEVREIVKEKKVPVVREKEIITVRDVLVGGECADWSDEHDRFHFDQKQRQLETHQEFKATISEDRKQAKVEELSPKTGETLRTIQVPIVGLALKPRPTKWRLEAGAMIVDGGDWHPFVRGTYRPSRFTFVTMERSDDYRLYGGVAIDF